MEPTVRQPDSAITWSSVQANQTAVLHEAMIWSVVAYDADGTLLAFSDPAPIAP